MTESNLSGSQSDYQSKGRDLGSLWRPEENLELPGRRHHVAAMLEVAAVNTKIDRMAKDMGFDLEFLHFMTLALYGIAGHSELKLSDKGLFKWRKVLSLRNIYADELI